MGFEPTRPNGQEISSLIDFSRDEKEWFEWAVKEAPSSAKKYLTKLRKSLKGHKISSPKELMELIKDIGEDRNTFNAIRNYIRFLEKTGKLRRGEADDFRAVVPNLKSRPSSETEKSVSADKIINAYKSITGKIKVFKEYKEDEKVRRIRQVFFKFLLFSGLRVVETIHLFNQFNSQMINKTIRTFNLEEFSDKVAVYDMETVEIPTRKHSSKRCYIAIFPRFLVEEIEEILSYNYTIRDGLFRLKEMYSGTTLTLKLLRKFNYNYLNDNALRVAMEKKDLPADIYRLIDFIQGRTQKEVGGRSYRANVQAAVRLYYYLIDDFLDDFRDLVPDKFPIKEVKNG